MSSAYDTGDVLPGETLQELPAGTNVAIVGPALSGKREMALQLLASGYEPDEAILCITTESAEAIYENLERHIESLDRDRVGIVNASGGEVQRVLDATIESVSSPSDLTGISISTAKLSQQFADRGISDIRYGLISVSTLLQYLDSKRVFQFLHVYTKRIKETGGLGIYTLDSDSHDQQVVNTITGQFDGVIQIRETEAGDQEYRVRGFGKRPTAWATLP